MKFNTKKTRDYDYAKDKAITVISKPAPLLIIYYRHFTKEIDCKAPPPPQTTTIQTILYNLYVLLDWRGKRFVKDQIMLWLSELLIHTWQKVFLLYVVYSLHLFCVFFTVRPVLRFGELNPVICDNGVNVNWKYYVHCFHCPSCIFHIGFKTNKDIIILFYYCFLISWARDLQFLFFQL